MKPKIDFYLYSFYVIVTMLNLSLLPFSAQRSQPPAMKQKLLPHLHRWSVCYGSVMHQRLAHRQFDQDSVPPTM